MASKRRLKTIGCRVFEDELRVVAQQCSNDVDIELLDAGLHAAPEKLRLQAQDAIDRASRSGDYDAVCLVYGLCGRGTVGLIARTIPLVIPRVHDCIALFLGSQRAYREQFARRPGTFYFTTGWYRHKAHPDNVRIAAARRFDPAAHPRFAELREQYGEDNARYIVEFFESWRRNYQRAALIDHGFVTPEHEQTTRAVAEAAGWEYEKLEGSLGLLEALAGGEWDARDFVVIPPGHEVIPTNDERVFAAMPLGPHEADEGGDRAAADVKVRTFVCGEKSARREAGADVGLGIDAGGTYTDAVLYEFSSAELLGKAKSLTTHDDLTRGIAESLAKLDASLFARVSYVCLSTTLATNAVVEGRGQQVGLVLMPYHQETANRIKTPLVRCIDARMNIHGEPELPVIEADVLRAADEMIGEGAASFAVSGYASVRNPEHELQVRNMLRDRFGLPVVCGHELSEQLNFISRAHTAVLNARLLPLVAELLLSAEHVLAERGIEAPLFVVRGDGSVIHKEVARERAIESILSGPAASATGGRFLTGCEDALVVDMGGTTTDVALLQRGRLVLSPHGARVGRWRTSVAAADIQTSGLGGDSMVRPDGHQGVRIGPERVVPLSFLAAQCDHVREELQRLVRKQQQDGITPDVCDFFVLVRRPPAGSVDSREKRIAEMLAERPRSRLELSEACGSLAPQFLRVRRLERIGIARRSSLTPTDALHALGRYGSYDVDAARAGCRILGRFLGLPDEDVARLVVREVERQLALSIVRRELAADGLDARSAQSEGCRRLLELALEGGGEGAGFRLEWAQLRPVIGIGAPIRAFLPGACGLLGTEPLIPNHAEVANAIGAVTSEVVVTGHAHIRPGPLGNYVVHAPDRRMEFGALDRAEEAARDHVVGLLRRRARRFGTAEQQVQVEVNRHVARLRDGSTQLVEIEVTGFLSGPPAVTRTVRA